MTENEEAESNPFVALPRAWCAGNLTLEMIEAQLLKVSPDIFVEDSKASAGLKALYESVELGNIEPLMPVADVRDMALEMPPEEPLTASEVAAAKAEQVLKETKWMSDVPWGAKPAEFDFNNFGLLE